MSLEMAHKVIVPQKKIMSLSFINSGTLIVIINHRLKTPPVENEMSRKTRLKYFVFENTVAPTPTAPQLILSYSFFPLCGRWRICQYLPSGGRGVNRILTYSYSMYTAYNLPLLLPRQTQTQTREYIDWR
jgi:hypothetical protein